MCANEGTFPVLILRGVLTTFLLYKKNTILLGNITMERIFVVNLQWIVLWNVVQQQCANTLSMDFISISDNENCKGKCYRLNIHCYYATYSFMEQKFVAIFQRYFLPNHFPLFCFYGIHYHCYYAKEFVTETNSIVNLLWKCHSQVFSREFCYGI